MRIRSRYLPILNKKKDFSGQRNKLGLSLRRKKGYFGRKLGGKVQYKCQKLTNCEEKKKRLFRPKKQAGAELQHEKRIFWAKYLEKKLGIRSRKEQKKDFLGKNCEKN